MIRNRFLRVIIVTFVMTILVTKAYNLSFDQCPHENNFLYFDPSSKNLLFYVKYENKFNDEVTFEGAVKKCKLCFDGTLVTEPLRNESVSTFYPTWIGVYRLAKSNEWKWSNGTRVDSWRRHADVFHLDHVMPDVSYGVIIGRLDNETFWLPIPFDQSLYNNEFRNLVLLLHHNNDAIENLNYIVCARPYRSVCHYWNVTDSHCNYAKRFGCHRHAVSMVHPGDDPNSTACSKPAIRRFAMQCPENHCICNVTEWSEWSDCSAQSCSDGVGQRQRVRHHMDPTCPKSLAHNVLKNTENCTVFGCDQLVDNGKFDFKANRKEFTEY